MTLCMILKNILKLERIQTLDLQQEFSGSRARLEILLMLAWV